MLINAVCRALGKSEKLLPRSHQLMLFWAGLRGAVAFALASGLVGDSAPAMRTTILAVVVLTVLLFGGTTNRMLQLLEIRTGVIEADDSGSEDDDHDIDPVGYRKLRRLSNSSTAATHYHDDILVDLEDIDDHRRRRSTRNRTNNNAQDVSIDGLLSGPLGNPIPDPAEPHWFISFDEKWLKPLFTKQHIQARNQTLAEYWREKRRKMDRANRGMLAGIRNMSFGQASTGSDDYDTDVLTLNSVGGGNNSSNDVGSSSNNVNTNSNNNNNNNNNHNSRSPHQKLVIGSGRVFGRSPASSPPDSEQ